MDWCKADRPDVMSSRPVTLPPLPPAESGQFPLAPSFYYTQPPPRPHLVFVHSSPVSSPVLSGDTAISISSSSATKTLYKGTKLKQPRGELFVYLHTVCMRLCTHSSHRLMFLPFASCHGVYAQKQKASLLFILQFKYPRL